MSAETQRAFALVDARLDAGDEFEAICRRSLTFARAVEEARQLRAFAPGRLRAAVVDARSNNCATTRGGMTT